MNIQPANPQPVSRVNDDSSRTVAAASSSEARRAPAADLQPNTSPAAAPPPASAEQLKSAVSDINRALRQSNQGLEFSIDSDTDRVVIKMTDTQTGEVIRQIPSEETLAISRSIGDFQQGMLLRQQA
jgi:flagellar protein FlaG